MTSASAAVPFELEALRNAHGYQRWVGDSVSPWLGQRILEIGAGIGNMSQWLPLRERLILTEGEAAMIPELRETAGRAFGGDPRVEVRHVDLAKPWREPLVAENLDTIVSFNVLEHIEDDARALEELVELLRASEAPGPKRLVSFVPAHGWAYGEIDRGFLHHRRYSRADFRRLRARVAPDAELHARYFNVFGLPGWLVMGRLLKRPSIGTGAIRAFERVCPWVRPIDDFLHEKLGLPLGQSLLCVLTLPPR